MTDKPVPDDIATLRAENERLRKALAAIDQYEIFADASIVNQIFMLKNIARAATAPTQQVREQGNDEAY